jgi:hypothetical protein
MSRQPSEAAQQKGATHAHLLVAVNALAQLSRTAPPLSLRMLLFQQSVFLRTIITPIMSACALHAGTMSRELLHAVSV